MRIGIDARTLSGRFTGDRTYWRGLIQGLAQIDSVNEYFLYTRKPVDGDPPATGPNFHWRVVPKPDNDAMWMQLAFPKALLEDKVDIAHTQYNTPFWGMQCPIVTTVHDITFKLFPEHFLPKDRLILNRFVPGAMRRAVKILTPSESTRRDILRNYKHHVEPDKVKATLLAADARYKPLDPSDLAKSQELSWELANKKYGLKDKPYILSVGVLQPRKNLRLLIDAFALVKLGKKTVPHSLVIVGKRGWLNDDLDKQLKDIPQEIVEQIIFTGYVPDEDLPVLYGGADAFCYPSVYEGFGLPPLEAMACGGVVLVSQVSSLPEVVDNAGILLPVNDSDAWARALEKILNDPMSRNRWRERGLERAKEFRWERTASETLAVYQDAVGVNQ